MCIVCWSYQNIMMSLNHAFIETFSQNSFVFKRTFLYLLFCRSAVLDLSSKSTPNITVNDSKQNFILVGADFVSLFFKTKFFIINNISFHLVN